MRTTNTSPKVNKVYKGTVYNEFLKRFLDFSLALLTLITLDSIFVIIAVLVRLKLGNPIIPKQQRPGLNKKIFTVYKFRTMTNERD